MGDSDPLLIGVDSVDITPPLGVDLAGNGSRHGGADEVGHCLRAEAMVCRKGDAAWVLVTSDVTGYPRDLVARVRQKAPARWRVSC